MLKSTPKNKREVKQMATIMQQATATWHRDSAILSKDAKPVCLFVGSEVAGSIS